MRPLGSSNVRQGQHTFSNHSHLFSTVPLWILFECWVASQVRWKACMAVLSVVIVSVSACLICQQCWLHHQSRAGLATWLYRSSFLRTLKRPHSGAPFAHGLQCKREPLTVALGPLSGTGSVCTRNRGDVMCGYWKVCWA